MHLAVLVVGQRVLLQAFGHHVVGDDDGVVCFRLDNQFQYVEQLTGVSSAVAQHGGSFLQLDVAFTQDMVGCQCPLKQFQQVFLFERLQYINLAARQQRADDFERGIFCGGADQCHDALFDSTQQRVLLRLAETVDFVNEKDGVGLGKEPVVLGTVDHVAHVFHTAGHGAQRIERGFQLVGNDLCQCRLTHSRRSPQDEGGDASCIDHLAEHCSRSDQMFLADVFV